MKWYDFSKLNNKILCVQISATTHIPFDIGLPTWKHSAATSNTQLPIYLARCSSTPTRSRLKLPINRFLKTLRTFSHGFKHCTVILCCLNLFNRMSHSITHPATFSINPALHHCPVLCVNNSDLRPKLINPDLERCPCLKTFKKNVPFHMWNKTFRCYSFQSTYHAFHSNLWRSFLLVTEYFIFRDGKQKHSKQNFSAIT